MKTCAWCRRGLEQTAVRWCSKKCRQAGYRMRCRSEQLATAGERGSFAYADPPYPGMSSKYYRDEPTFAGEVDHRALIASLGADGYKGWALSTSSKALRDILPLCPPDVDVCPWVKPIGASSRTRGRHNTWEPLIVWRGRELPPGRRDWLLAQPARFGGDLPGRKPIAFIAWMFDLLGMSPGDDGDVLTDLFPGSGVVGRAWQSMGGQLSPRVFSDARRSGTAATCNASTSATP